MSRAAAAVAVRRFAASSGAGTSGGRGRGPVSWLSLGLTAAVGGGLVVFYNHEKQRRQTLVTSAKQQKSYGKPALGGAWTLVDMQGKPVTSADYEGKYTLLYFGFTRCPDICPSELVKVGTVLDKLPDGVMAKLRPLFISVDPNRDTLEQLRVYAKDFHPAINYLTGTKDMVDVITKAYRVYFIKANENEEDEEDYLVDHSTVLYLVGPTGDFEEFYTSNVSASEIARKIENVIAPRVDAMDSSGANPLAAISEFLSNLVPKVDK